MTPEEKELHEFFKCILSEKAKEKFDRLMEISQNRIWNFCHEQQIRIVQISKEIPPMGNFHGGALIAYRKVQYEINKKCSNLDEQT